MCFSSPTVPVLSVAQEAERARLLHKVYHMRDAEACRQVLAHTGHKPSPSYRLPAYVASRVARGGEAALPCVVVREAGPSREQEGRVTRARKRKQDAAKAQVQQHAVLHHVVTHLGGDSFGALMELLGPRKEG